MLGAGCIHRRTAALCKCAFQFFDRTGLLRIIVVPAAEHFEECPLGPFVIFRVAGADFAGPVVGETYAVQLLAVTGYIVVGCLLGMLAGLDGILFCRKAEGIIAHRMQDIESSEPLVAAVDVAGYIAEGMSDVKSRP